MKGADKRKKRAFENDTPYTTISHCDLWTNNIMYTCGMCVVIKIYIKHY